MGTSEIISLNLGTQHSLFLLSSSLFSVPFQDLVQHCQSWLLILKQLYKDLELPIRRIILIKNYVIMTIKI